MIEIVGVSGQAAEPAGARPRHYPWAGYDPRIVEAIAAMRAGDQALARILLEAALRDDHDLRLARALLACVSADGGHAPAWLASAVVAEPAAEAPPRAIRDGSGRARRAPAWARWARSPGGVAAAYLLAVALAELVTALVEPRAGVALHALILLALSLHAAATWDRPLGRLLAGLTLVPLIRVLSMGLPLARYPLVYWYFIVSVPLFAATVIVARALGLRAPDLGLTLRSPLLQLAVAPLGLLLGYVEYLILKPEPLADSLSWGDAWLPALILLVCTGLAEELIFRGLLRHVAAGVLGRWERLYVATLFAVLHVGYLSWADVGFVFAVAYFFGWVADRTDSIVGVTLAHGLTNIALFLIVPFLV